MRALLPLLLLLATAAAPASAAFTIGGEPFAQAEILDARAIPGLDGAATIMLTFMPPAAKRLEAITAARAGKPIPVALDGKLLVEPVVAEAISGGVIEMDGHFPVAEAQALAKRISGKDPLPDSLDQ